MALTLLNAEGKFVAELRQEGKTLSELGIADDFTVKVEDRSGKFVNPMSGSVEHYKINEDSYEQREESFRNFKKRNIPSYIAVSCLFLGVGRLGIKGDLCITGSDVKLEFTWIFEIR
jgi:hypothetical protein